NDAMIFFNFRPDRAIQLSKCFANDTFSEVKLHPKQGNYFVQMTPYSEEVHGDIAFASVDLHNTIGEVLANHSNKQLFIAETEKITHFAYFMNSSREEEFEGEKRSLINTAKVATYDLQPEMSAYDATDALRQELDKKEPNAVILNFATPDMVGHSGKMEP